MPILGIEKNNLLKTKLIFSSSEEVQKTRLDLEICTESKFQEIDKNRSLAIDESRKKYLD